MRQRKYIYIYYSLWASAAEGTIGVQMKTTGGKSGIQQKISEGQNRYDRCYASGAGIVSRIECGNDYLAQFWLLFDSDSTFENPLFDFFNSFSRLFWLVWERPSRLVFSPIVDSDSSFENPLFFWFRFSPDYFGLCGSVYLASLDWLSILFDFRREVSVVATISLNFECQFKFKFRESVFRIFSNFFSSCGSDYLALLLSDCRFWFKFRKKKNRSILQLFVLFIILKLVWFRLSSLNLTGGQFWFEFRKAFVFFLPIF